MRPLLPALLLLLTALAQGQAPAFTTTESMQKEAKASVILLERLHISKREMASIDMAEVVRTYCENLDGAKMYFTEAEVEDLLEEILEAGRNVLSWECVNVRFTSSRSRKMSAWSNSRLLSTARCGA